MPSTGTDVPDVVVDLLTGPTSAVSAHLATAVDDRPHVAPVWFAYRPALAVIEILTAGKKLRNVRANPRVALSIERADGPDVAWSVVVLGTARVITREAAPERVAAAVERIYGKYRDGDPGAEDATGPLVAVSVGSVTYDVYE